MPKTERISTSSEIPEDRLGKVENFGEMKVYLPNDLTEGELKMLHGYFDAQKQLKKGKKKHADRKFDQLDKKTGFREFENRREGTFRLVDLAARGSTNRKIDSRVSFYT